MQANSIAFAEVRDFGTNLLNGSGYFMTKRNRQIFRGQKSAAVMRIRMTNAGSANANQYVVRADIRRFDLAKLKRAADFR